MVIKNISNSQICNKTNQEITVFSNFNKINNNRIINGLIEISSENDNFNNPTVIGNIVTENNICTIPTTINAGRYKLRLKYTYNSTIFYSLNTISLNINNITNNFVKIKGSKKPRELDVYTAEIEFSGTGPFIYKLSNYQETFIGENSPINLSFYQTESTNYKLIALENVCPNVDFPDIATVQIIPGLQYCLPFNGNTDGTCNDCIVEPKPELTEDRFSNSNQALIFDGISQALTLQRSELYKKPNYSYSVWVKTDNLLKTQSIIEVNSNEDNPNLSQLLILENSTGLVNDLKWVFKSYTRYGIYSLEINSEINVNEWYYVTVTRSIDEMKLFINGKLLGIKNTNSNPPSYPYYGGPIINRLGVRRGVSNTYFSGKIDDVKVYNDVLSDYDIAQLYIEGSNGCYQPNETSKIIINDLSTYCTNLSESIIVNVRLENFQPSLQDPIKIELSNNKGEFINSTIIGEGILNNIECQILQNLNSGNYKIRAVYGQNKHIISINTKDLTIGNISAPTAEISGNQNIFRGSTAQLIINFTGIGPWKYKLNNSPEEKIAFVSPTILTITPLNSINYTLTSVKNNCGIGTFYGQANIIVNDLPLLMSCFQFNNNALDSKNINLTAVNGATLISDRFGIQNSAYNFTGSSNYISIYPCNNFKNPEYSYSFWFKLNDLNNFFEQNILEINNEKIFLTNSNGFRLSYTSRWGITAITETLNNLAQWHFVTVTRSLNEMKIYFDSKLMQVESTFGYPATYTQGNITAFVGNNNFNGAIDDLKIYNEPLNEGDIKLLFLSINKCNGPCNGLIQSVKSGEWNNTETWSCFRIPNEGEIVLINEGHKIDINDFTPIVKSIINNGIINFINQGNLLIQD